MSMSCEIRFFFQKIEKLRGSLHHIEHSKPNKNQHIIFCDSRKEGELHSQSHNLMCLSESEVAMFVTGLDNV